MADQPRKYTATAIFLNLSLPDSAGSHILHEYITIGDENYLISLGINRAQLLVLNKQTLEAALIQPENYVFPGQLKIEELGD